MTENFNDSINLSTPSPSPAGVSSFRPRHRRGMEDIMDTKTREILNRPFDRASIKERIGPGARTLSYVAIGDYVARLNEAFDGDWSHEITDTRFLDEEVIVQVRLTAAGMIKMGMGGAAITRRRDSGKVVSIAQDAMSAEATALKRACRTLGIGAALYLDDEELTPPAASTHGGNVRPTVPDQEQHNGSPRITSAQIGKLRSLVAEAGGDWGEYRTSVREKHHLNVEYADRKFASTLIQELIDSTASHRRPAPANGNGHGHGHANGNGQAAGWRRP